MSIWWNGARFAQLSERLGSPKDGSRWCKRGVSRHSSQQHERLVVLWQLPDQICMSGLRQGLVLFRDIKSPTLPRRRLPNKRLIKQKSMKRSPSPLFTVHAAALLTWGVFLSASFNTESKQWRSFHRTFPHPNLSFFKSRAAKHASCLFKMRQPARGTFSFSCYEKQTSHWSTGLQLAEWKRITSYLKPCYI